MLTWRSRCGGRVESTPGSGIFGTRVMKTSRMERNSWKQILYLYGTGSQYTDPIGREKIVIILFL